MKHRAPRTSRTTLPPLESPPATILDWLCIRFPRIPRTTWEDRMDRGMVTDSSKRPLHRRTPYAPHKQILYYREVDTEPLSPHKVEILLVDDHLVVVDKPPFVPVTPGGRFVTSCLLYTVERQLGLEGLAPAHRLDRGTSGVLLLVRRREERKAYGALFAKQRIDRLYEAVAKVPARPEEDSLEVESRIVPGDPFFLMKEAPGEPNARTLIRLLSWHEGLGRFELRPRSGKTHQLRLHMASLGWPIVGDRLYPRLLPEAPDEAFTPLGLVAKSLAFVDPITGQERCFETQRDPADPHQA